MSSLTRIICLTHSGLLDRYLFAGIDPSTGNWIRPVTLQNPGLSDPTLSISGDQKPELGDILLLSKQRSILEYGYACETVYYDPGPWYIEGKCSYETLHSFCSKEPMILHNSFDYVTIDYLQSLPFQFRKTLQLISATDFKVLAIDSSTTEKSQWYATFRTQTDIEMTLMIRDIHFIEKLNNGHQPNSTGILSISLSAPWKPMHWNGSQNPCWKVIVGVIEKPQTINSAKSKMKSLSTSFDAHIENKIAHYGERLDRGLKRNRILSDENETRSDAKLVLSTVISNGQCFTADHIVAIITETHTSDFKEFHHQKVKNAGIGKHKSKRHWWRIIDNLIAQKYLVQTDSIFPVLKSSPKAMAVLNGVMDIRIVNQYTHRKHSGDSHFNSSQWYNKLLDKLRLVRRRIASVQQTPPYNIFSDTTLRKIARFVPTTPIELKSIEGIGEAKMRRYGHIILREIHFFMTKNPAMQLVLREDESGKKEWHDPYPKYQNQRQKTIYIRIKKTWKMLEEGMTVNQIATIRGLSVSTIMTHIEQLILQGKDIDISPFIPIEKQVKIKNLFISLQTTILRDIVNASGGTITIEEARLVRALLKRTNTM